MLTRSIRQQLLNGHRQHFRSDREKSTLTNSQPQIAVTQKIYSDKLIASDSRHSKKNTRTNSVSDSSHSKDLLGQTHNLRQQSLLQIILCKSDMCKKIQNQSHCVMGSKNVQCFANILDQKCQNFIFCFIPYCK